MPQQVVRFVMAIIFCLALFASASSIAFAAGASISLSKTSGPPSTVVTINGKGFGQKETVKLYFDTTQLSTATTSNTGTFKKNMTIPGSAQPGNHTIKAVGKRSGRSAQAGFLVQSTVQADWSQFGFVPEGGRYNNNENTISVSNVSNLVQDWAASTGASFNSTVAGSPAEVNGIVYAGSDKLYAFNASTGASVWTAATGANIGSSASPTVANGVVYITTTFPGALYAFDAQTGGQLWSASLGNNLVSNSTVANGIIYVGVGGFQSGELEAFNAQTGALLWTALSGISSIEDAPAVVNGILYVGSADDHVYALNPQTGAQVWAAPTSDWVISPPAVANGMVYASTYDGNLDAFNASTGVQAWSMPVGGIAYSAPAVANGVVYVTSNDGHLYALNAQTGTQLLTAAISGSGTTSTTVANGIVYFGSNDHNLYAFHL